MKTMPVDKRIKLIIPLAVLFFVFIVFVLYIQASRQALKNSRETPGKTSAPVQIKPEKTTAPDQTTDQSANQPEPWIKKAREFRLPGMEETSGPGKDEQEEKQDRINVFRTEANRKSRAGDLHGAIKHLHAALDFDPGNKLLKRDLSHLYAGLGWTDYRKKGYIKAGGFFEEALFYWPENSEAMRGLGYSHYRRKEHLKAEAWFQSYIEVGSDRPDVYNLLAMICYDSNRLEEAIYYLRMSLMISPEQPAKKELLDKIVREKNVEADFDQVETRHFTIKYEGQKLPEVKIVVEVICEEAYIIVGRRLGHYPDDSISVILYTDKQFKDVTKSPAWANAIFDGKIRIPAKGLRQRTEVLERIIFHEYTHAVVHDITRGRAPIWLHEGLAEMNEEKYLPTPPLARRLITMGGPAPLRQLEGSFLGLSAKQAKFAYTESLLAVQYLESEYGPFALRELLRYLSEGNNTASAIRELTYRDYDSFYSGFEDWVKFMAQIEE